MKSLVSLLAMSAVILAACGSGAGVPVAQGTVDHGPESPSTAPKVRVTSILGVTQHVNSPVVLQAVIEPAVAGVGVYFQQSSGSTWQDVTSSASDSRGVARVTLGGAHPAGVAQFRAVEVDSTGSVSVVSTPVIIRFSLMPTRFTRIGWPVGVVGYCDHVTVSAWTQPVVPGRQVNLQGSLDGKRWVSAATAKADSAGGVRLKVPGCETA